MKALVGAFNQKALVGTFSVIVKPMDRFTALVVTPGGQPRVLLHLTGDCWRLSRIFSVVIFFTRPRGNINPGADILCRDSSSRGQTCERGLAMFRMDSVNFIKEYMKTLLFNKVF